MASKPLEPADYPDRIGAHLVRIEGDTICIKFIGVYATEDVRRVLSMSDDLYRQYGTSFLLGDLTQVIQPPPEARKLIANWPFLGRYAMAAYGVSTPIRAIIQLMQAARRLLGNQKIDVHVAADEQGARQWIVEQRRTLQAAKSG